MRVLKTLCFCCEAKLMFYQPRATSALLLFLRHFLGMLRRRVVFGADLPPPQPAVVVGRQSPLRRAHHEDKQKAKVDEDNGETSNGVRQGLFANEEVLAL